MDRRHFLLQAAGGLAGGLALARGPGRPLSISPPHKVGDLPRRRLGRTGAELSVVGFPGYALAHTDQAGATDGIRRAYDRGVNYFDVAPAYGKDGECEIKMGVGLQGLPRERIFLSCKTKRRDAQGAREELERSLRRLKTDYLDLYQCHCFFKPGEVDRVLGPGGALETMVAAQQAGTVRHLGFSAHTTLSALAGLRAYAFDTVMFPINYVEAFAFGFGREVVDLAAERGTGILAIKTISAGAWGSRREGPRRWWYRMLEDPGDINLALRFTLSQRQVVSAIPPSFLDLFDKTVDAAADPAPLSEDEMRRLRSLAAGSLSVFQRQQERALAGLGPLGPWPNAYT